ncbi:DUF63 family protein [Halorarius halobius]|uniref:DUF63 family protein n=1 Tax=Halorarius halobius TaxID=2962671 RepID=UPI0020CF603B|nr:DUF63 family protein [Halorarius halobius]
MSSPTESSSSPIPNPFGWDRGQAWLATAAAVVAAFALGYLVAPELVWDRFLWHYFWGPVFADANNAVCAVMQPGGPELVYSQAQCAAADSGARPVAEPGYTVVSEIGYALTLIFFLVGLLDLLERLEVGRTKTLFYALVPFMFFGGALRVVEDANDAIPQGVDAVLAYPWNTLIISPIIYFTVFGVTLAALTAAVVAARRGTVESYDRPLFAFGWLSVVVTVGFLAYFVLTELAGTVEGAGFYPQMTGLTLGIAAVLAYAVYRGVDRYKPEINEGTGLIGLVVLFGHAVDGVANVIAADWIGAIGVPVRYGAKHPVNRFIIDATQAVQPAWLSELVGTSWPFLVVKLVAATAVVWVFDETIFEEEPRYAILLLVAILAVGLGPGSRDMLRATFGI